MKSVRGVLRKLDWITVGMWFLLVLIGWVSVFSAYEKDSEAPFFFLHAGKQVIWILLGLTVGVVILFSESRFFLHNANLFYAISIFLLLIVTLLAREVNSARSWMDVGFGLKLQPSEFAKVTTLLAVAKFLSRPQMQLAKLRNFLILTVLILLPVGLIIAQKDAGTAIVFFAFLIPFYRYGMPGWMFFFLIFLVLIGALTIQYPLMYLIAGMLALIISLYWLFSMRHRQLYWLLLYLSLSVGAMWLFFSSLSLNDPFFWSMVWGTTLPAIFFLARGLFLRDSIMWINSLVYALGVIYCLLIKWSFDHVLLPHHRSRIELILGMKEDRFGVGYNVNQALVAYGSGGLTGRGYLQGTQTNYGYVPAQHTDFIFTTVGESFGLIGSLVVIGLYVYFLIRITFIAERQRLIFARLYGYGVVAILLFHFFINIGMTLKLVPVIGIPLPFFSYGGSSFLAFSMLLFILLRMDAGRMEYALR